VLLAVALVAMARLLPRATARGAGSVNWRSAALLGVGLAALLLAISQASSWGWGSARTMGLAAVGTAGLALWVRAELAARAPLVDVRMFRRRSVWVGNVVAAALNVGLFSAFVLLPRLAANPPAAGIGFGATDLRAGLLLVPLSVTMFVVALLAGRAEARVGGRLLLMAGCLTAAAAYALLCAARGEPAAYVASGLVGVGMGLAYGTVSTVVTQTVSPAETGVAIGVVTMVRTVGGACAAQLVATLLATSLTPAGVPGPAGFRESFVVAVAVLVLGAVAASAMPVRPQPAASTTASAPSS